jgi:hypothetical protein
MRGFCGEIEATGNSTQFDLRNFATICVERCGAHGIPERQHLVGDSARPQQFQRARLQGECLDVVGGSGALSMIRTGTLQRASSIAAVIPVGPAPTMRTGNEFWVMQRSRSWAGAIKTLRANLPGDSSGQHAES